VDNVGRKVASSDPRLGTTWREWMLTACVLVAIGDGDGYASGVYMVRVRVRVL